MKPPVIAAAIALFIQATPVLAQSPAEPLPAIALPPLNIVLPNYGGVPIGEIGGLEAGAFLARANDTSSTYYNPAGLTRAEKTSVSGTAGAYQWGGVSADGIATQAGSFQQVPAMFAIALQNMVERPKLSAGLSIARTYAWSQAVDLTRTIRSQAGDDRLSYSSEAALDAWLASIGIGYAGSGKWRVGAAIDGQLTISDRRQAIADQYRAAGNLALFSISSRSEGTAGHLRFTAGTQYDLTPQISLGAVFRTRGFGVYSTGFTMLEGLAAGEGGFTSASLFDDDPEATFKVPFELKAGAAFMGDRGEVEIDVLVYGGAGQYETLSSSAPIIVTAQAPARPPSIREFAALSPTVHSTTVINVAMGGHLKVTSGGAWVAHGGFATDRSPVGANDTVFTKAHLQKITAGLSARTSRFLGSLGVQYEWGSSEPVKLRELPLGTLTTVFRVSNFGVVYSLSVLF